MDLSYAHAEDSKDAAAERNHEEIHNDLATRGQEIVENERSLDFVASVMLHWKILLFCIPSFTAGFAFGYDTVVNGASISMPAFLLYFGDVGPTGPFLPSFWTAMWTSMSSLAQAVGGFGVGFLSDRFGRKYPTVAMGAITMVGTAMQYVATTRALLLGGKIVNGIGIGGALATGTAYASEIAPLNLRGPIQSALVLSTVAMQGVALGVIRAFVPNIAETSFRIAFALQWVVGGLLMLSFFFVPESPIYLINSGKADLARKALARLHGADNHIDERLAHISKTIQEENGGHEIEAGSYLECFNGANLKRTLTVIFTFSSVGMTGGAFLAQNIYFLIIAGLPAIHSFDIGIGGFGLAMIFIVISWFTLDKLGRRLVFIGGCAVVGVGMLIIGCLAFAPGTGPLWAIAVIMNFLISFQSVSVLATGFVVAAELSSYHLRAKTQAIGVISYAFWSWFFTFTVPYMYNVDSGNLGAKTGFVFVGTTIVMMGLSFFLIPDTNGMTVEEVDWLYAKGIAPRKFRNHIEEMKMHFANQNENEKEDDQP